jgi:hypothetical protein
MTTVEDFVAFVQALDACWLEGRFEDLYSFLAGDIIFVAPGGKSRFEGITHAIESYRQFMSQAQIRSFATQNYIVTRRRDTAIIEYDWEMRWLSDHAVHNDTGRELLVLSRRTDQWRVVWRTQLPLPK